MKKINNLQKIKKYHMYNHICDCRGCNPAFIILNESYLINFNMVRSIHLKQVDTIFGEDYLCINIALNDENQSNYEAIKLPLDYLDILTKVFNKIKDGIKKNRTIDLRIEDNFAKKAKRKKEVKRNKSLNEGLKKDGKDI